MHGHMNVKFCTHIFFYPSYQYMYNHHVFILTTNNQR